MTTPVLPRSSGILLHPTSLPGPFGIGDLGLEAERFVDHLGETGQTWWQILPVGPTGFGNSPYQSHSSYAGIALMISRSNRCLCQNSGARVLSGSCWLFPA